MSKCLEVKIPTFVEKHKRKGTFIIICVQFLIRVFCNGFVVYMNILP